MSAWDWSGVGVKTLPTTSDRTSPLVDAVKIWASVAPTISFSLRMSSSLVQRAVSYLVPAVPYFSITRTRATPSECNRTSRLSDSPTPVLVVGEVLTRVAVREAVGPRTYGSRGPSDFLPPLPPRTRETTEFHIPPPEAAAALPSPASAATAAVSDPTAPTTSSPLPSLVAPPSC